MSEDFLFPQFQSKFHSAMKKINNSIDNKDIAAELEKIVDFKRNFCIRQNKTDFLNNARGKISLILLRLTKPKLAVNSCEIFFDPHF